MSKRTKQESREKCRHDFHLLAGFAMDFATFPQHFYFKWLFTDRRVLFNVQHIPVGVTFTPHLPNGARKWGCYIVCLSVCLCVRVIETQHVRVSYHTGSTAQLGGTTSWVPEPKPWQQRCQKQPKPPPTPAVILHTCGATLMEQSSYIMNKLHYTTQTIIHNKGVT